MYTTASIPIHYSNDLNNISTCWYFYPKPQQFLRYHNQTNVSFNDNSVMDSSTKLKHKEVVLYKTESCRNWTELGHCRYGKKCRYAHGSDELRTVPRHSRYKTQICRAYHMDGSCPYGIRCTFVHDSDLRSKQDIKMIDDNHINMTLAASQSLTQSLLSIPSSNLDKNAINTTVHNSAFIRRRSSFGSHDDELSTSGSSSGDESLVGAALIDLNHSYYRRKNAKNLIMKRKESIETMYYTHYNNNFNNNNRTAIWM